MVTDQIKIVTHITPEADKKVEAFMKKAGMTKARVCSLAIIAGIDVISRAIKAPPTDNMGVENNTDERIENK